jgi:hypothetical protein
LVWGAASASPSVSCLARIQRRVLSLSRATNFHPGACAQGEVVADPSTKQPEVVAQVEQIDASDARHQSVVAGQLAAVLALLAWTQKEHQP